MPHLTDIGGEVADFGGNVHHGCLWGDGAQSDRSFWEELQRGVGSAPVLPAVAVRGQPDQGEMAAAVLYKFSP